MLQLTRQLSEFTLTDEHDEAATPYNKPYNSIVLQRPQKYLQRQQHPAKTLFTIQDIPFKVLLEEENPELVSVNPVDSLKKEIFANLKKDELNYSSLGYLEGHEITPLQRSYMIDWMIEVTDSFNCDHQTFFYAVSIMDRYMKAVQTKLQFDDVHLLGATSIFIASKFEDTRAISMKEMLVKICHNEFDIEEVKEKEKEILTVLDYDLMAPTPLDFLRVYLEELFGIQLLSNAKSQAKEKEAMACHKNLLKWEDDTSSSDGGNTEASSQKSSSSKGSFDEQQKIVHDYFIEKVVIYYAKMCMHDSELPTRLPSVLASGIIQVSLKVFEQIKKQKISSTNTLNILIQISELKEELIFQTSKEVLKMAQNFDKNYPSLSNLRNTHFQIIMKLMDTYSVKKTPRETLKRRPLSQ